MIRMVNYLSSVFTHLISFQPIMLVGKINVTHEYGCTVTEKTQYETMGSLSHGLLQVIFVDEINPTFRLFQQTSGFVFDHLFCDC